MKINQEGIKKYNQVLLAVLGSAALVFVLIGIVSAIALVVSEITRSYRYNPRDNSSLISTSRQQELNQESQRRQIVAFENVRLIDTVNYTYIIPVSQKTLNSPESIGDFRADEYPASSENFSRSQKYRKTYYYQGSYNNVLIFDSVPANLSPIFDSRVNLYNIQVEYFKDEIFLLLKGTQTDSNENGQLDQNDLSNLYLYSLSARKLHEIHLDNATVYNFSFLQSNKDLVVMFGLDRNKNGTFEESIEPTILKQFEPKTGKTSDLIPKNMVEKLQKIIDARPE